MQIIQLIIKRTLCKNYPHLTVKSCIAFNRIVMNSLLFESMHWNYSSHHVSKTLPLCLNLKFFIYETVSDY